MARILKVLFFLLIVKPLVLFGLDSIFCSAKISYSRSNGNCRQSQ